MQEFFRCLAQQGGLLHFEKLWYLSWLRPEYLPCLQKVVKKPFYGQAQHKGWTPIPVYGQAHGRDTFRDTFDLRV